MKNQENKELEQSLYEFYSKTDKDIPAKPIPEYLSRMASRNAKNYNPQNDEFLISDIMEVLQLRIKPALLTDDQKQIIAKQFNNCQTMKSVYKVLDRVSKHLNLAFFNFK